MRIGFYFEASIRSGGTYQYALNLLEAFKQNKGHNYVIFNVSPDFPFTDFKLPNWEVVNLIPRKEIVEGGMLTPHRPSSRRYLNLFVINFLRRFNLYRLETFLTTLMARRRAKSFSVHGLDLLFFGGPSEMSFLTDIPSIVPIHDLQHRLNPQFPEVSQKGQLYKREYIYKNIKKRAYKILVDSEAGKEDVINCYGVSNDAIEIVPFLPPFYLDKDLSIERAKSLTSRYNLPEKFLFYPAQFWPHKNHRRLIEAIKILRDEEAQNVNLVLVGTSQGIWGELDRVKEVVKRWGLEKQVYFSGYAKNEEMGALYKLATALVMPTFFGPTNIPILEAWYMGCPVLYSDIRGCREQAGDAAILFNPMNSNDIAEKIKSIWLDNQLRQDLIAKGNDRLRLWTRDDFYNIISKLINEFAQKYGK